MSNANRSRDTTADELLQSKLFQDPISGELLTEPVVACDGYTYNKATIPSHQPLDPATKKRTPLLSPATGYPLCEHVTKNCLIADIITELRKRQGTTSEETKDATPSDNTGPEASRGSDLIIQFFSPLDESDDPLAWWLRTSPITLLLVVVLLHTPGIIPDEAVRRDIATFFMVSFTCASLTMVTSNLIFLLASLPLFTLYALAAEPLLLLPVWVTFFTLKLRYEFYCWVFAVKSVPFTLGTSNYMFALVILWISLFCLHLYKTNCINNGIEMFKQWTNCKVQSH